MKTSIIFNFLSIDNTPRNANVNASGRLTDLIADQTQLKLEALKVKHSEKHADRKMEGMLKQKYM